jgi:hypothetical protein
MNSGHTIAAISKISLVAISGFLFLGCASGPVYTDHYNPVPAGVTASPQTTGKDILGGTRHVVQTQERQEGIGIAEETEPLLDQSGFESMPLDSPGEQSVIGGLAPFQINALGHDHQIEYWFSDPDFCKCAYEGDEIAYATFQQAEKHQEQENTRKQYIVNSERQVYWPMNTQWDPVEGWWTPDSSIK